MQRARDFNVYRILSNTRVGMFYGGYTVVFIANCDAIPNILDPVIICCVAKEEIPHH